MDNNIFSANLKSKPIVCNFDKKVATKNIVTPNLVDVHKVKRIDNITDNNFNNMPLVEKEYTFQELVNEVSVSKKSQTNSLQSTEKIINFEMTFASSLNSIISIGSEILELTSCVITSFIESIFKSKKIFDAYLTDLFDYEEFNYSDIYSDDYIPQGVTTTRNGYIISAYTKEKTNDSRNPSRLYFYDKKGQFQGYFILDNNAHVGGITYDHENGMLFITGKTGKVNVYDYTLLEEIISQEKFSGQKIEDLKGAKIGTLSDLLYNEQNASTVYYYDGYLYAITYEGIVSDDTPAIFGKYKIEYERDSNHDIIRLSPISKKNETTENVPRQAQGIAITTHKDKKYMFVIQSNLFCSDLLVYELDEYSCGKCIGEVSLGFGYRGAEGIKVQDDGQIIIISEVRKHSKVMTIEEVFEQMDEPGSDGFVETFESVAGAWYDSDGLVSFLQNIETELREDSTGTSHEPSYSYEENDSVSIEIPKTSTDDTSHEPSYSYEENN